MEKNSFEYYVERYLDGTITIDEWTVLRQMIQLPEHEVALNELMDGQLVDSASLPNSFPVVTDRILASLNEKIADHSAVPTIPVHRVHLLRRGWFRYAAAILIIFGSAAYLCTTHKKSTQTLASGSKHLQTDIAPGGERALLTLADGRTITLDSAANGQLANQGGVKVIKLANGQVAYDLRGLSSKEVMWNTMSTPIGGQYQVTLPDGTRVWLNASSSITFPTAFTGANRTVKIQGEMYFEVAKNKQQPFVVDIDGKSSVEVLGTSFNINSYVDEGNIKTTLLEGSVRLNTADKSAILKPGEQALMTAAFISSSEQQLKIIGNPDIEQALAWKNGIFNFNGSDLSSVARQLERWYDIKVKYESAVPDVIFKGEMNRGVKLSTVLNWFSDLGIKTRLDGKTLIVL